MNIYFICTGNTCRSPMAEAILKSYELPNVEVRSAGIFALDGGGISENAKRVLEKAGMDSNHHSRNVTQEGIEWAHLILTMTSAHKSMLLSSFPEHEAKIFTLKEYVAPYSSKDISDPFGGDLNQYKQTFNELKQYIDKLIIENHLKEDE